VILISVSSETPVLDDEDYMDEYSVPLDRLLQVQATLHNALCQWGWYLDCDVIDSNNEAIITINMPRSDAEAYWGFYNWPCRLTSEITGDIRDPNWWISFAWDGVRVAVIAGHCKVTYSPEHYHEAWSNATQFVVRLDDPELDKKFDKLLLDHLRKLHESLNFYASPANWEVCEGDPVDSFYSGEVRSDFEYEVLSE
jgi:hypothetical protein